MSDVYMISLDLHNLMQQVIEENPEFDNLKNISIACLEKDGQKKSNGKICYADCTKVSDKMLPLANCEFVITFYQDGLDLDRETQYKLMYHELMHCGYDEVEGKCSIVPHDLEDFKAVIDKWGTNWIKGGKA